MGQFNISVGAATPPGVRYWNFTRTALFRSASIDC